MKIKEKLKSLLKAIWIIFVVIFGIFILKYGFEYMKLNSNSFNRTLLQKDSDGDGLSDNYEKKLFNKKGSSFKYNKNISDLPLIKTTIADKPFLIIDEEVIETSTNTTAIEVGRTVTKAHEVTQKIDVTAKVGYDAGFVASLEGSYSHETKDTDISENSYSESNSSTKQVQYTLKQGKLVCPIYLKNYGNLPATIEDITLIAVIYDESGTAVYCGTLKFDGNSFPKLNLEGNSDQILLNFVDENLFSDEIDLLSNVKGEIEVDVVSINLSSPLINNYINQKSLVKSKSVRVIVSGQNPLYDLIFDVSVDDNNTFEDIARNMGLDVEYRDNWIYSVNGDRADQNFDFSSWSIKHIGQRSGKKLSNKYSINTPAELKDIRINKGDVVYFFKEKSNDVVRLYDANILKEAYRYNFSKNNESIVKEIYNEDKINLYTLQNIRDFKRIDNFYKYGNYDLTEKDLDDLYYKEKWYLIMEKYQEQLNSGGPDPDRCLVIAKHQVDLIYPKSKWINEYIKNNELIQVDKSVDEYSSTTYRSGYYDYLLKNEIKTLSVKKSKVVIKLKETVSKELILKLNPSKIESLKLILVNGEKFETDSIHMESLSLKLNTPEYIEFYSHQFSSNKESESLRLVERIEFK